MCAHFLVLQVAIGASADGNASDATKLISTMVAWGARGPGPAAATGGRDMLGAYHIEQHAVAHAAAAHFN